MKICISDGCVYVIGANNKELDYIKFNLTDSIYPHSSLQHAGTEHGEEQWLIVGIPLEPDKTNFIKEFLETCIVFMPKSLGS